ARQPSTSPQRWHASLHGGIGGFGLGDQFVALFSRAVHQAIGTLIGLCHELLFLPVSLLFGLVGDGLGRHPRKGVGDLGELLIGQSIGLRLGSGGLPAGIGLHPVSLLLGL
ncbi:MAG: hypothetical protein ACK559_06440, partial [bacterium]